MTDPTTGRLGALLLSGWISTAPDTGADAAFLLLTSPGGEVPTRTTMPLLAREALALDPATPVGAPSDPSVRVEIGADLWIRLHTVGGEYLTRPVSAEWAEVARRDGRVVLIVGYDPSTPDMSEDDYTTQVMATGQFHIGLLPVS